MSILPNIKTIRGGTHPLGTGDFTTIQSWEDWASTKTNPHQWAECYGGCNLGLFNVSSWSSTPTSSGYPRIFASSGEAHGGVLDRGPLILPSVSGVNNIAVNYTKVEGVGSTRGFNIDLNLASNVTIENCWAKVDDGIGFKAKTQSSSTASSGNVIKNCVALGGTMNDIGFEIGGEDMQGGMPGISCYNCTAYGHTNTGFKAFNTTIPGFHGGSTITIQNCVSTAASGSDFSYVVGGHGGNLFSNNVSSDSTSAQGSSNSLFLQDPSILFMNPTKNLEIISAVNGQINFGGDFRPARQSPLSDNGIVIDSVLTDIRGLKRTIGTSYDIGAYESFSSYYNTASLYITSQIQHNDSISLIGFSEYIASGEAPLFSMGSAKFDSNSNTPIINGVLKPAIPPPTLYIGAPKPFNSGVPMSIVSNYYTRQSPMFLSNYSKTPFVPGGISFTGSGVYNTAALTVSAQGDTSTSSRHRLPFRTMPLHVKGLGNFSDYIPSSRDAHLFLNSENKCFSNISAHYEFELNDDDTSGNSLHFTEDSSSYVDGFNGKAASFTPFAGNYFKRASHESYRVDSSENKSVSVSFWIKKKLKPYVRY